MSSTHSAAWPQRGGRAARWEHGRGRTAWMAVAELFADERRAARLDAKEPIGASADWEVGARANGPRRADPCAEVFGRDGVRPQTVQRGW